MEVVSPIIFQLFRVILQLSKELNNVLSKLKKAELKENSNLKKLTSSRRKNRIMKQRLKRRMMKIKRLQNEVKKLNKTKSSHSIKQLNFMVLKLKDKVRKCQNQKSSLLYSHKKARLFQRKKTSFVSASSTPTSQFSSVSSHIHHLENENDILKEKLEMCESDVIPTLKDGKTFDAKVRECVYY